MKGEQKGPYRLANGRSLGWVESSFEVVTKMRVETMVYRVSQDPSARPFGRQILRGLGLFSLLFLVACSADPQLSLAKADWVASPVTVQNDPRKLEVDLRTCQVTAKSSQGTQADSFSDPRYGAVNAMADALGRDSINETSVKLRQSARFELCMQSRGWKR